MANQYGDLLKKVSAPLESNKVKTHLGAHGGGNVYYQMPNSGGFNVLDYRTGHSQAKNVQPAVIQRPFGKA